MHYFTNFFDALDVHARVNNTRFKRCFDVVFASSVLILILPLLVIIALAVFLVSGSAPIYSHKRVGLDGKPFGCLKFRSMVPNADEALKKLLESNPEAAREWEAQRKLRDDPRILPGIGHFLRQSSLDELPQFFNVLLGDMSIVGPRPVVEDELHKYGARKQLYLSIRPGITGPWQVGARSNDTYENRVLLDANYVLSRSMAVDVKIIMSTVRMVLRGRNHDAF